MVEKTINRTFSKKTFWDNKILHWEVCRYQAASTSGGLEYLSNISNTPVRERMLLSLETLKPHLAGKRVVELGCGSGQMVAPIITAGAAHYTGYDFSSVAIQNAQEQLAAKNIDNSRVIFKHADIANLPQLEADIVFSLGLIDWLTDDEIEIMFQKSGHGDFLHAIAERRTSIKQFAHKIYVFVAYGWKTQGYTPRYFSEKEFFDFIPSQNVRKCHIIRTPKLGFAALVTSLPEGN